MARCCHESSRTLGEAVCLHQRTTVRGFENLKQERYFFQPFDASAATRMRARIAASSSPTAKSLASTPFVDASQD
eukprot:m.133164 g.133164  ORF g.133164 m.133164 type:complete len:75 (-) comp9849_c0_seq3:1692-1916(-)